MMLIMIKMTIIFLIIYSKILLNLYFVFGGNLSRRCIRAIWIFFRIKNILFQQATICIYYSRSK